MKQRAILPMLVVTAVMMLFGETRWSQEFKPSKQIEAVVHTGPGGGSDIC